MTYTISPSMGEPYTVTALIVITLGGFGSMSGALVGGPALGVIEAVGMHFTSPSLNGALQSHGIFIAVLLWRPNGLSPANEYPARSARSLRWPVYVGRAALRAAISGCLDGAHLPDVCRCCRRAGACSAAARA